MTSICDGNVWTASLDRAHDGDQYRGVCVNPFFTWSAATLTVLMCLAWSASAKAECEYSGPTNCSDQGRAFGFANQAAVEKAAIHQPPHSCAVQEWGNDGNGNPTSYRSMQTNNGVFDGSTCANQFQKYSWSWGSACVDLNPIGPLDTAEFGLSDVGSKSCLANCAFTIQMWCGASGVGLCSMFAIPDGTTCGGMGDDLGQPTVPDGCSLDGSGTVVCDCTVNPGAWFCANDPSPNDPADNCIENVETGAQRCIDPATGEGGSGSADPGGGAGDPNTNQPGGGGGGEDPPPGVGDDPATGGSGSCVAGDADCFNDSGSPCQASDTSCSTSTGTGGGGTETNPEKGQAGTPTSCDAAPFCSGKPVECAILRQNWEQACQLSLGSGDNPIWDDETLVNPFDPENQEETDLSQAIDTGGFLGGGSCPIQDFTAEIGSMGSMTIPFSLFCGMLPIIAMGFLVAGGIQSAYILAGAF